MNGTNKPTPIPRTGIGPVSGIAWIPVSGASRTRLSDGKHLPVLRGWYQLGGNGPQLAITLIPRDREVLAAIEGIRGPVAVRYHGLPRPWKSGGDDTVMAVMCDRISIEPSTDRGNDPAEA